MLIANNERSSLTVFDIETIIDISVAPRILENHNINDDQDKIMQSLKNWQLNKTAGRTDFLFHGFHKIVALSYLSLDYLTKNNEIYYEVKYLGHPHLAEEYNIVKTFFSLVDRYAKSMVLVSFNGKEFDIPVLMLKAMKYGITAKSFNQESQKYKDHTYIGGKYYGKLHIDLINSLWDFANIKSSLHNLCVVFDLPGKMEVSGEDVLQLYKENKLDSIGNYCDTDVINTYLVYLRHALHINLISYRGYCYSIESLINYLLSSPHKYLHDFHTKWKQTCNNDFYLQSNRT